MFVFRCIEKMIKQDLLAEITVLSTALLFIITTVITLTLSLDFSLHLRVREIPRHLLTLCSVKENCIVIVVQAIGAPLHKISNLDGCMTSVVFESLGTSTMM